MRMRYKITLSVLTIMILMTLTIGTSYSFYSVSDTQTNPNLLATTCFQINFTENSDSIKLDGTNGYAYPMSETSALSKLKPYSFKITNTCTSGSASNGINYIVTLNTLTGTKIDLEPYLHLRIEDKLSSTYTSQIMSNTPLTEDVYLSHIREELLKNSEEIVTSYNIVSGTLEPGASQEYNLYLWIDENACDNNIIIDNNTNETQCEKNVMGKSFEGKIIIYSYM